MLLLLGNIFEICTFIDRNMMVGFKHIYIGHIGDNVCFIPEAFSAFVANMHR